MAWCCAEMSTVAPYTRGFTRIPIWSRPWINARIIGGYPVEYRVFVYDGQAMGVSNYYPQRPLTNHRRHIDAIGQYTQALIDVIDPPLLWNYSPFREYFDSHFDTEGVHFTADYIVDADDNVAFLEGGPPHHLGAHPCCFPMGETPVPLRSPRRPSQQRIPKFHLPFIATPTLYLAMTLFQKLCPN